VAAGACVGAVPALPVVEAEGRVFPAMTLRRVRMEAVVDGEVSRGDDTAAVPAQVPRMRQDVPSSPSADDLPDGLVVADAHARIIVFNRTATRLTGIAAEAALGHDFRDVLPLHDGEGRDWWKCVDPYGGLRTRTRHPERSLFLAGGAETLVTAAYTRDAAGRVERFTVSLRDAAQRTRQERDRADLVSTVAHELRSPLTSVKGFTATLLAKWHRFNDDQKRVMLETVNADADRVTRLITELLDVSRIEAGRLEMRRQVVDLAQEVRKVIAGRVAAGDAEDRFRLDVRGPVPEMWLDPDKVGQILGNLVENAVRHGAGTVTIVVEPDAHEEGAAVSVRDEGEGIPPEAAQRVFRQFWRGSANRRGGTGLGLYIVKGLVEAHSGVITVQRAPGGGAEFRFTVPAGAPDYA
jgi:PAS domain S-box-containing protein